MGWIGVDLDGTLAFYLPYQHDIGAPIALMKERVLTWLSQGIEVRIFTARACDPEQIDLVKAWLSVNGMGGLAVTNAKDFGMIELWDDRAVQVEVNTGRRMSEGTPLDRYAGTRAPRLPNTSRGRW